MAHIYPASYQQYAVSFENIRARRHATRQRLDRLANEYIAAAKAIDPTVVVWTKSVMPEDDALATRFLIAGSRKAVS